MAVALRRAVPVLLRLLRVALMTAEAASGDLGLEAAVLGCLPLADVANEDVLALHRDERDPAQLEPRARLGLYHLGVVAARTHARRPIALLFDLCRAAEDDRDEETEVLRAK